MAYLLSEDVVVSTTHKSQRLSKIVDSQTSLQSPSNKFTASLKSPTSRTYTGNNFPRTQVKKLNKHYRKSVLQDSIA